ncbi:dolichyldiphosphatase 1, partial [Asbolus verrucosus]
MATSGFNEENFPKNLELNDRTDWVPLSLTLFTNIDKNYKRHNCNPLMTGSFSGDFVGKILALISLAPFGIGAGFVALILFRRDLHTITFFLGTLCSEALNYCLKHTICEERPMRRTDLYGEYGMPSSHAQFVWFFATYVIYFVFIRLHHMNNNTIIENVSKILIISSSLIMAILVCISRIYLQYHTISQVLCGAFVGILFATFWFALTYLVFTPLFPQVVS